MPTKRYFQNRLATSSFLLPVAACIGIVLWIVGGIHTWQDYVAIGIYLLCIWMIMELNNAYVLLRIRSRMVSSLFCVIWGYSLFAHTPQPSLLVIPCMLAAYHSLFHAYQQTHSVNETFQVFICIGICSIIHPILISLAPVFLIAFAYFRAISIRSIFAMFFGLLVPWIIGGTYAFLNDQLIEQWNWITHAFQWNIDFYKDLTVNQIVSVAFLLILTLISTIHLYRNSYQDKIRTRLLLSFLVWMTLFYTLLLVVQPQYFNTIYLLLVMNTSPLIAHFLALTGGKWTNRGFLLILLIIAGITAFNLWIPSFRF